MSPRSIGLVSFTSKSCSDVWRPSGRFAKSLQRGALEQSGCEESPVCVGRGGLAGGGLHDRTGGWPRARRRAVIAPTMPPIIATAARRRRRCAASFRGPSMGTTIA